MARFDVAKLNSVLQTREVGRNLIFEPSVGSTMDLARDAARQGAVEGTVAIADEQTAGRGRLGRTWITPPALNLASTIVVRPPTTAVRALSMITPLAVAQAVEEQANARCDIKWPNDVLIAGKKLAGILIETVFDAEAPFALIGAGINVNFDAREHEEIRDIATSLLAETGRTHDRETLLASYLLQFERLYDEAKAGESSRDRWRERLVTLGQRITATTPAGVTEGVAEDVDDDGALLVRTNAGALETIEAGDVTLRT